MKAAHEQYIKANGNDDLWLENLEYMLVLHRQGKAKMVRDNFAIKFEVIA